MLIALQNFKVKHIVVTVRRRPHPLSIARRGVTDLQGHTNCVGCTQALRMSLLPPTPPTTALQRFVQPVAALSRVLTTEDGPPTLDLLVEENVVQQVRNLVASEVIQDDWKRRGANGVVVHGWVYHLEDVSDRSPMRDRADHTGYYPRPEDLRRPAWACRRQEDDQRALLLGGLRIPRLGFEALCGQLG
jgi:hypothetical protein